MAQKVWTHSIVGAGAAGCVLAHRLSENRDFNVLLIEAGGSGTLDPTLKVPMMTAILLRGKRHVWQYLSDEEAGLEKRQISLPRGKVLGGSSCDQPHALKFQKHLLGTIIDLGTFSVDDQLSASR